MIVSKEKELKLKIGHIYKYVHYHYSYILFIVTRYDYNEISNYWNIFYTVIKNNIPKRYSVFIGSYCQENSRVYSDSVELKREHDQ